MTGNKRQYCTKSLDALCAVLPKATINCTYWNMEESTVCIWQFVLFSVVGQLDIVCRGCSHRPAFDCFISQINCHICNFHFNMVYYKSNTKSNTAQCPIGGEPMPISISTGRKMQMFLLDLLYPNRCPCCNCSISWREYLCEACRQEAAAGLLLRHRSVL